MLLDYSWKVERLLLVQMMSTLFSLKKMNRVGSGALVLSWKSTVGVPQWELWSVSPSVQLTILVFILSIKHLKCLRKFSIIVHNLTTNFSFF